MINYEQKIFFYSIIVSAVTLNFFGNAFYDFKNQILLFLLPIIWPGLAHGSLDLEIVINRGLVKKFSHKVLFFILYLSIIIAFFVLWINFPNTMFLVFLLLSATHFGISDKVSRMKYTGIFEILIRAALVIVLPLKFYPEVTSKIFIFLGLDTEVLNSIKFANDFFFYFLIFIIFIWLFLRNES